MSGTQQAASPAISRSSVATGIPLPAEPDIGSRGTFSPRIAMVVDDDPIVRDILRVGLAQLNQDVLVAANGHEALRYARIVALSMVVLDLDMPVLNGLTTCEQLRRLPGFAAIPVIVLTGHDHPEAREAARRVGATEFITKPFRPIQLMGMLSSFLELKPQQVNDVRRDAERATLIDRLPPQPPGEWIGRRNTPNPQLNRLDRAKRILDALRF